MSYLSGVLIGHEICGALRRFAPKSVTIIAGPRLAGFYNIALTGLGVADVGIADVGAVTARGLWRTWRARKDST